MELTASPTILIGELFWFRCCAAESSWRRRREGYTQLRDSGVGGRIGAKADADGIKFDIIEDEILDPNRKTFTFTTTPISLEPSRSSRQQPQTLK